MELLFFLVNYLPIRRLAMLPASFRNQSYRLLACCAHQRINAFLAELKTNRRMFTKILYGYFLELQLDFSLRREFKMSRNEKNSFSCYSLQVMRMDLFYCHTCICWNSVNTRIIIPTWKSIRLGKIQYTATILNLNRQNYKVTALLHYFFDVSFIYSSSFSQHYLNNKQKTIVYSYFLYFRN